LSKEKKREIVQRFETHSGDTGSAEVQIALLTERIETLSQHFEKHKKDNQKSDSYKLVLKELGLRR
jgi:small subunit ribosomal protein S15